MHRMRVRPAWLALLGLMASVFIVISPAVAAADSFPELQWANPATVNLGPGNTVTEPSGNVTVGCNPDGSGQDLVTYNSSGAVVRQISRTAQIDGVNNCIMEAIADKNGVVYGVPYSGTTGNYGSNLLAYSGNTLKWKYPVHCGSSSQAARYAVGADGNIYATQWQSDGAHLIGLTPEVAPPLTGPAKVLDIKIPADDCRAMIKTYKDGLVLHGQSTGGAHYYSYSGKYLGNTTGNLAREKVNADGRLYSPVNVSGTVTSASVKVYDPYMGQIDWTTSVSTPGADVSSTMLQPLAGGGVVALIREKEMDSGVPAVPAQNVYTLAVVNANGQKTSSVQLDEKDTQGNQLGAPDLRTDATGKVVMVREVPVVTGVSWPTTMPKIVITKIDASGTMTSAGEISGTVNAQDQRGYTLDYASGGGLALGTDTMYIVAHCTGDCSDHSKKLYPVKMTGLGMEYPRGAMLNAPTSVPYVALGDSFSSGEGVLPFANGTETPGTNECHRSRDAYAGVVGRNTDVPASLGMGGFHACSGAITENITTTGQYNEDPQVNHLNANTKVVTLTIGGNDVGFKEFATACVSNYCGIGSNAYNTSLGEIDNNLGAKLTATYQAILTAAPNAQIYVLGYPHVAPVKAVDDPPPTSGATCAYLYDFGGTAGWGETQAIRSIVSALNAKITDKITAMSNARLHYIDVNASSSPFAGHTVCADSGESFFYNIDQAVPPGQVGFVFHPNQRGQEAYAQLVAEALS